MWYVASIRGAHASLNEFQVNTLLAGGADAKLKTVRLIRYLGSELELLTHIAFALGCEVSRSWSQFVRTDQLSSHSLTLRRTYALPRLNYLTFLFPLHSGPTDVSTACTPFLSL